jgi:single-strand DNA-binding protein
MINKWIGIGNVCADVEVKYGQSGTAISSFTVACNEKYKGKDGNIQEQTEFVRIVAFARLAEICGEYLSKGSKVYIEGKLQTRKWQAQDGTDRYTTEIVAKEMKMLSPKSEGGYSEPPVGGGGVGGFGGDIDEQVPF